MTNPLAKQLILVVTSARCANRWSLAERAAYISMHPESATLDALDSVGDGLCLAFYWRVDRYAHRVERIESGAVIPLIESIEGSDLDHWPPSPALKHLSRETLPDGRTVALLVGMAGASHWSMTAEREAGEVSLLFDVACRVKEGSTLGTAYRSLVRHEPAGGSVLLHRPGGTGKPAVIDAIPVQESGAVPQWDIDARGLQLRVDAGSSTPQTVRWKYRVQIAR